MSVEWTREQQIANLAFQKILSEAGVTKKEVDAVLARYSINNPEELLRGFFQAAKQAGVEGKYSATFDALEKEYSDVVTIPEGWLGTAKEQADKALAQAADVAPEVVDEALSTTQRLGARIPSLRRVTSAIDPVRDADLIQKATQARQWAKQKAAYDTLYKAGSFAQGMVGEEMGPYGFKPAITPHAISPEELLLETGKLTDRKIQLIRLKKELSEGAMRSASERERTRRELTSLFHKQYNENLKILSTNKRAEVDRLADEKTSIAKSYSEVLAKVSLKESPDGASIQSDALTSASNHDAAERAEILTEALSKLSGRPESQYLLILQANAEASLSDEFEYTVPGGGWENSKATFIRAAHGLINGLDSGSEASLEAAFDAYHLSLAEGKRLKREGKLKQDEIDSIVLPGTSALYSGYIRKTDPFVDDVFEMALPGEAPATLAAPPLDGSAAASNYVSGVLPGATLSGSDVVLPSGEAVSYADFSLRFPQATVDPATGNIVPEMAPVSMMDKSIEQIDRQIEAMKEPQLSEMDLNKEEIMSDPRFDEWMEREGYSSREKAYEFFTKEYAQRRKMRGPATDRQMRDANILSGGAPAPLAERIGAVARTAVGPEGRSRRQRRRQALLSMLSPGPRGSRVTETDAVEEGVGEAPETAKVTPETAPAPAQQTWIDDGDGTEYTLQDDGTITYSKADGTEISVKEGETGYDAIMGMREGWSAETQAKGKAYIDAMAAEGVVPTGLPTARESSREELKEELAAVPGAETREGASLAETERIGLRERIEGAKEEREMRPLTDKQAAERAAYEAAHPEEVQAAKEAEEQEKKRKQALDAAQSAADAARAKGERPPEWAAAILDTVPLVPQGRGEIQRATTEPSTTEEPGTKTTGTGSEGVPLSSGGHLREGTEVAKERTVPAPSPRPPGDLGLPVGGLVGTEGEPVSEEEQRVYKAGEAVMEEVFPPYVPPHERLPRPPDDPGASQFGILPVSREEARRRALLKALTEPSSL